MNATLFAMIITAINRNPTKIMYVPLCLFPAIPGAPGEAYCVDLTNGNRYILPDDTPHVSWVNKPTANGGRCDLQGVLKITPPTWARSVSFHMAFEKPSGWSFNIGDSPTNDGYGKNIIINNTIVKYNIQLYKYNGGFSSQLIVGFIAKTPLPSSVRLATL